MRLFKWNAPFTINGQNFVLAPKKSMGYEEDEYIARCQPVVTTASQLSENLTVKPYDTKSSVIQLWIKTGNLQKGRDILNALFAEFNLCDIEDLSRLFTAVL